MAFDGSLWGRRVQLTGLTPVATAAGFVALITEENLQGAANEAINSGGNSALNGGGDLRFSTDNAGTNQLPLEVVNFTVSSTPSLQSAQLWIRFPSYESANRSVWMFYNRAGQTQPPVTDAFGRNAVWQDFEYNFHFNSSNRLVDSTGNHVLQEQGTVATIDAIIGDGTSSSNTTANHFIVSNYFGPSGAQARTHKVWVRSAQDALGGIFGYGTNSNGQRVTTRFDSGTLRTEVQGSFVRTVANFFDGEWHSYVSKFDGTDQFPACHTTVVDGSVQTVTTGATRTLNTVASNQLMFTSNVNSRPATDQDEQSLRLFRTSDSLDELEYNNQSSPSTFWATGTPEDTGGSTGVSASISFDVPSPAFSVNASNTRPTFDAQVNIEIPSPEFAITASVTSPNFDSSIAVNIPSPTFSVNASNTRPEFNSTINFEVAAPEFSITASNTQPGFSSNINLTVPSPIFSVEASVTFPVFEATIGFEVPSPIFFITNLPLEADFTGTLKSSSFSGIINQVEFTGYVKTQSFSGQTKTSEFRGTIKQSIFTGVYNGNG